MARLSGKVALVTGSSRGIGAAIARRLAKDGAAVVVNYAKSAKSANEVVAEITAAGGEAIAVQGDVSDAVEVKRLFEAIRAKYDRIDIVVNNAGIFAQAPLAESTVNHYRQVFDLNVQGPILVSAEATKSFPKSGGRIINVSSVLAKAPLMHGAIYGATKAAVENLTINWALELGPRNITVNAVAPGLTVTEMTTDFPQEARQAIIARTPLGRLGQPEDIADAVAFLASDDARWVTGQTLTASGGLMG